MIRFPRVLVLLPVFIASASLQAEDYSGQVVEAIARMPKGGTYARYRKEAPENQRFDHLYEAVAQLNEAIGVGMGGKVTVSPGKAGGYSFCSSATYLLFADLVGDLQSKGKVPKNRDLSRELALVGDKTEVIHGKLDGIGIFGHWNADGPGTAVLFERLDLGTNFSDYEKAKPGDFLKIFWNENIGKGESGHLVVYLGTSPDGKQIQVWSSQTENTDGSAGYGTMWVEKTRIKRAVFSRLERPENLVKWLEFSPAEKQSDYLIRIRQTGSTGEELKQVTDLVD